MDRATNLAQPPQLDGWLPIRVDWNATAPLVDWCHVGARRFNEPFFEQTIERCLREPFSLLFRHQTPLEVLLEWQRTRPGLSPSGFIFHMSRCGSTLMAQMLAAAPQNIVMSEAPPISGILRAKSARATDEQKIDGLRAMLSALGQRRSGAEQHFFVKFDSWHTFNLPLVRRAFPDVPWIFLYRDPLEVMASQLNQPGVNMVPGLVELARPEWDCAADPEMSAEERCARILSGLCAVALEQLRTGGRAVNYSELPGAVYTSLPRHFRLDWTDEDLDRMRAVTQFDAKNPSLFYAKDGKKIDSLTPFAREMSALWLEPIYEELERLRTAQLKTAS